ncbi:hypothetical protein O3M35_006336 [Rhynocoris fuscipes]|uniref:Tetraspanin n=1 Tax=Rhynocoris fuscipes TaxID=488301 RepID=A0AAW1DKC6_9HEMI
MGFCEFTLKCLLFVFNFICVLAGLVIIGVGVYTTFHEKSFKEVLTSDISTVSITLLILGLLIVVIACFGCCGALKEDICQLITYAVILLVILLLQIVIGIAALVYEKKFDDVLRKGIAEIFDSYGKNNKTKEIVDRIQIDFKCCGLTGPDYWSNSTIPASCCGKKENEGSCTRDQVYKDGCQSKIIDEMRHSFKIMGGIAIGFAAVEIICILLAFCLISEIKAYD